MSVVEAVVEGVEEAVVEGLAVAAVGPICDGMSPRSEPCCQDWLLSPIGSMLGV